MPKTKRDLLKRQLGFAYRDITLAIKHIANVEEPFSEQHPEYGEALQVACVVLGEVQGLLDHFAAEAWGRESIDWDAYANLPAETIERQEAQLDVNRVKSRGVRARKSG